MADECPEYIGEEALAVVVFVHNQNRHRIHSGVGATLENPPRAAEGEWDAGLLARYGRYPQRSGFALLADGRCRLFAPLNVGRVCEAREMSNEMSNKVASMLDSRASRMRVGGRRGGTGECRYWAFMANPTVYRIEEAVRHLRTDLWTTKGRDVRARDRVVIRKAAGRDGYRGIVALGEVLTDPELQPDADNPYWVRSPALDDLEERVTVRYELPSGLPLLKWREPDPVLDALSVSRATGGSIFNITPEQWEAVLAAAGGWPASAPEIDRVRNLIEEQAGRRGTQQGLRLNQDVRQAVEMLAIRRAQEHYERHGWTCEDVSAKRPYDLHCTRPDGREQRVEVKGTTGNGSAVLLTPNEVEHARRHQPQAALFVLADVQISGMDGSEPTATGGTAQILEPWLVEDGRLSPLGFSYILRP